MNQTMTSRYLTYMSQAQVCNGKAWSAFWEGKLKKADRYYQAEREYRSDALRLALLMSEDEWTYAREAWRGMNRGNEREYVEADHMAVLRNRQRDIPRVQDNLKGEL